MVLIKTLSRIFFVGAFMVSTANAANLLKVENAWSPEAPPVAKVMAGYMKISNLSTKDVKLISTTSNLFKRVEIHLTEMKGGMMRMVKQENLKIKANSHIVLKSGDLHMMLMGKLKPINKGTIIPVILTFDNGKSVNIELMVKVNNESEMMHHHHH